MNQNIFPQYPIHPIQRYFTVKMFSEKSVQSKYGSVTLPDAEIITELQNRGTVYRTDLNDRSCGTNNAKIGTDNDGKPGGCDKFKIAILSDGTFNADFWLEAD
jgi:hypothetical protein